MKDYPFIVWFRHRGTLTYAKVRATTRIGARKLIKEQIPSAIVGAAHRAAEDVLVTN